MNTKVSETKVLQTEPDNLLSYDWQLKYTQDNTPNLSSKSICPYESRKKGNFIKKTDGIIVDYARHVMPQIKNSELDLEFLSDSSVSSYRSKIIDDTAKFNNNFDQI